MTSTTAAGRPGTEEHDVDANFQRTSPPRVGDGVRVSDFDSVIHAQGAWRDDELHMAPVSGLLTAEILAHEPRPGLRLARLSFEILADPEAVIRFDGSDLMPAAVGAGTFWREMTNWFAHDTADQAVLDNIEASWPTS